MPEMSFGIVYGVSEETSTNRLHQRDLPVKLHESGCSSAKACLTRHNSGSGTLSFGVRLTNRLQAKIAEDGFGLHFETTLRLPTREKT